MGDTSKTAFANTSDWVTFGDLTQVFSGPVTYPANNSLMLITFDTPFPYNNTDNLVLAVDENQHGYDCSNYFGKTGNLGAQRSPYKLDDNPNPDPANPPVATDSESFINNVILGGIQQSCPFPTALNTIATTTTTADIMWTEYERHQYHRSARRL